jgi:hypothetical protein
MVEDVPVPAKGPQRRRAIVARVFTVVAFAVVVLVLIAPTEIGNLIPAAFLRVPVDGIIAVALVLLLPPRGRRWVVIVAGVMFGALAVVKVVGIGFSTVLDRPFDPVLDWPFLQNGVDYLRLSSGRGTAITAVIAAAIAALGVLVMMVVAFRRVSRTAVAHRMATVRTLVVLAVVWAVCAVAGAQIVPGVPVAGHDYYDRVRQVGAGIEDRKAFRAEAAVDAFRNTPGDEMLTALRGKNVTIALIESYGRVAFDNPTLSMKIGPLLDTGYARLKAQGYAARSGWLSSPTTGGGSWLAQSTLMSGVWIDNQQRYRELVSSDRLTLNGAFHRAGWRTVAVMPATVAAWPEGRFYNLDRIYAAKDLGYRGPGYAFNMMPDQYTLSAFQRFEMAAPGHPPVMAEIPLISSHSPWEPVPPMKDWQAIGDGSGYVTAPGNGDAADIVLRRDPDRVRADYANAISYSLTSLVSYVETYGNDDMVLVFLGDHQPTTVVTGSGASREVPITILAKDQAVLDRVAGWGWQDGLKPAADGPVWRMDAFRDRFLTAFGSTPH